jgi:hypothetical protein
MSVKVMGMVWDADLPRPEKFVLLAYADHANHDGTGIFPSVALISRKTGYDERSVQRITRRLENEYKLLLPDGSGPQGENRWQIPLELLSEMALPPDMGGSEEGGDKMPPPDEMPGGDKKREEGVTKSTRGGDIAVSPEPSFNRHFNRHKRTTTTREANSDFSRVIKAWEKSSGPITPLIAEQLGDTADEAEAHRLKLPSGAAGADVSGAGWVVAAIEEASRSASAGRFNVKYVDSIVQRWIREGFMARRDQGRSDTEEILAWMEEEDGVETNRG